jgi:excisionase family DNA binding protein
MMRATEDRQWLSIGDLAERYGVTESTVRTWRRTGTAPVAHKIGRHVRFRPEDVARWESARSEAEADDAA